MTEVPKAPIEPPDQARADYYDSIYADLQELGFRIEITKDLVSCTAVVIRKAEGFIFIDDFTFLAYSRQETFEEIVTELEAEYL